MVCLAKYFNKEVVGNVEAKLILIISCPHTGAEDHKDAAAAAQADQTPEGGAGGGLQLASHYAHSFVLDDSGYFNMQQVRWSWWILLFAACCYTCRIGISSSDADDVDIDALMSRLHSFAGHIRSQPAELYFPQKQQQERQQNC